MHDKRAEKSDAISYEEQHNAFVPSRCIAVSHGLIENIRTRRKGMTFKDDVKANMSKTI